MAQSIYEKHGGFKTVSRVVLQFYEMVLDSEEIGHHFDDVDMPRLIDHQTKFISSLLGGPASFSDDRLEVVHRTLGITHGDFDEVARLLGQALLEHGMPQGDVDTALAAVEAKRSVIVTREAG
ncbi:group I truncated hemoglobin [Ruegeria jejuensis]|uniref:group I truncated hemoglobin n=1 Tax=Ruegeria jejuensis TaxID=3233338 RepID=UPI00355B0C7C